MAPRRLSRPATGVGLAELRRSGAVSELLFLFECETRKPPKLRPIAERLDLTVQAVSHLFRQLSRRGLVELSEGRYRSTMAGVAWLHTTLASLGKEISAQLDELQVVRTTRAVAGVDLRQGSSVSLGMVDGMLTAGRGGEGSSRGVARSDARAGEIVEVSELEGIVPIVRGEVLVHVIPRNSARDPKLRGEVGRLVRRVSHGLLGAQGLDAVQILRRATREPAIRFGLSSACADASHLGVRSLVFLTEEELPRFLAPYAGTDAPPVTVSRLSAPHQLGIRRRNGSLSR